MSSKSVFSRYHSEDDINVDWGLCRGSLSLMDSELVFSNINPVTSYKFHSKDAGGQVDVAALSNQKNVPFADFANGVKVLSEWVEYVQNETKLSTNEYGCFVKNYNHDVDKIDALFKVENKKLSDIVWNAGTNTIDIKPIAAATVSWSHFVQWNDFLKKFVYYVENF